MIHVVYECSMFAIIMSGGKQYRVQPGDTLKFEKLPGEAGEKVSFEKVLLIADNGQVTVGKPFVERATVEGELVRHGRHDKIIVQKFKSKVRYRRKKGHRQHFTEVRVTAIKT